MKITLLVIVFAISVAQAGPSTETPVCVGPAPTSHPTACERMLTTVEECNAKPSKEQIKSCFCSQDIINVLVYCKEETRQCLQSKDFDSETDQVLVEWHRACDPFISEATITTPSLTPLTTTFVLDDCSSAAQACLEREHGISTCSSAHSADATGLVSCLCESSQVDLASRCDIDGVRRCDLGDKKGVDVTDVWEYKNCNPTDWPTETSKINSTTPSSSQRGTITPTRGVVSSTTSRIIFSQTASSTSSSDSPRLRPPFDFVGSSSPLGYFVIAASFGRLLL